MEGKRFLHTISVQNFLSFGASRREIELLPLNVLIGPNGSGKSNLIEAIALLKATPSDLTAPIREGGGIGEWLWKGGKSDPTAEIDVTVSYPDGYLLPDGRNMALRYRLSFTRLAQRFELVDEAIENESRTRPNEADVFFYYRYQKGHPVLNVKKVDEEADDSRRIRRGLHREDLSPDQSVLSQRKDPDQYPEITYLVNKFSKILLYREWALGHNALPRLPQKPDLPVDSLSENASNLGLVLNDLLNRADTANMIKENLQKFNNYMRDVKFSIHGGTVQILLDEEGLSSAIPATRLSDGTLRFLFLLVILSQPSPPPLICLEEPEIGLHPDILDNVADLLVQASKRTQLVVTTHSDVLVSALSEHPESVLVCEREDDGTQLRRLDREKLKDWLDKYSLGELWRMGEVGGN
jgi:predicted ATPase